MGRSLWVAVSLLLAGGAATSCGSAAADSSSSRATPSVVTPASIDVALPSDEGPFFGSKRVTLDEAIRRARFARERPDDPIASDGNLTVVWAAAHGKLNGRLTQLAFEYGSGVEVQLQPWASTADPASVFSKLAAEFNLRDALTTIGTDPAIVVSIDEASPASVEFVRGGIKITVFGEFSDAVLRRVAESIP
jgi:hypothetical protein